MFRQTPNPGIFFEKVIFSPQSLGNSMIKRYIMLIMNVLIIHLKDQSTDFLKPIYASISNKTVINGGIGKDKIRKLIKNHDRVIMLGHGTPKGLLSVNQFVDAGSYIIDSAFSELLSEKSENIFIWCHADQFVKRNGLSGFFYRNVY